MYKTILTFYLFGFLGLSYAQEVITEAELIEFLGEFDEEDELILEKTMIEIEQVDTKTSKQSEPTEVNDENTID